jgi:NAD(P)-dependent dehydrogenase (short-subunit alcohol dehydrogenase family)
VLADLNEHEGRETQKLVRENGAEGVFVKCDVSDVKQVRSLIATTVETYGRLDYAFNNAGIEGEQALTAQGSEENWDRVLDVNLKSVWACMKFEILEMLKSGGGAIVNCASIAGLVGFPGMAAYVASKHGMVGLTKTTALEYVKQGIRVNAVCPGVIDTPMITRYTQGDKGIEGQLAVAEPIGRIGRPQEIADAVVWLCSDRASFVTGIAMPIDGGWVAQ